MELEKRVYTLVHPQARQGASNFILHSAPDGWQATVEEPPRTKEQNAAQWPILGAFSRQLLWPVNGQMVRMSDEEWKDVLTAAFKGETVRLAMGLYGGVVMLGQRTSGFKKSTFSDWLEFLNATAAARGVDLTRRETQAA